jgi:hypothetical protein
MLGRSEAGITFATTIPTTRIQASIRRYLTRSLIREWACNIRVTRRVSHADFHVGDRADARPNSPTMPLDQIFKANARKAKTRGRHLSQRMKRCRAGAAHARSSYLSLTLPFVSRVTLTGNPSFIALPRHIPWASFRSPKTLKYPFASICDFA